MLGSSYGSTAPASLESQDRHAATAPTSPTSRCATSSAAQKAMLDGLGVTHLVAVAGPSFGGYQAFQWAVTLPRRDARRRRRGHRAQRPRRPGGGRRRCGRAWPPTRPGTAAGTTITAGSSTTMTAERVETLAALRHRTRCWRGRSPIPAARDAALRRQAAAWAREFDPNSLLALRKASVRFDAERDFAKIRAKVLYVLSRTDKLFPPSLAPGVMDQLTRAGIQATYFEIDTELGHVASGPEWAKWGPTLRTFLEGYRRTGHRHHAVRHRQAAEICVVRSPKWRFPSLWRSFPGSGRGCCRRSRRCSAPSAGSRRRRSKPSPPTCACPRSEVWDVASHYPELRLSEPGRRVVRVCTGLACLSRGGRDVLVACERRLGVRAGQTTADGGVTLEELDCAFACASAPVVTVDHDYPRSGEPSPDRVARLRIDDPSTRSDGAPWDGAGHGLPAAGSPGRSFHGAQARGRASSHGRPPGGGPRHLRAGRRGRARPSRRCARRSSGAGCRSAWSRPAATACAGRSRSSRCCATAGRVSRRGADDGRHRPATPQRARRRHAGARDRRRRRLHGAAAPRPPRAVRHGRPVRHRRRASGTAPTPPSPARSTTAGPRRVIEEVRAAGLAGRGGAYFQTAVKWTACRAAAGTPKYLVVNGEEGEPGIFKDRHLMEGDPHRLLEAVLLAAFAAGAARPSSISTERPTCRPSAWRWRWRRPGRGGSWGRTSWAPTSRSRSTIRRGAGGFVLGEETALLESIEGQRAMPRTRPPFPVESGLFGRPTVINNVETLFAVPSIVERGGAWFASLGGGHGTKVFGLSGHVRRPGVVEMEIGCTLRTLIERRRRRLGQRPGDPRRGRRRSIRARGAPAPVRRAAGPARGRQSRHRGRGGPRRQRDGARGGSHAARLQRARIVRQVHALPRGHRASAGPAGRSDQRHSGEGRWPRLSSSPLSAAWARRRRCRCSRGWPSSPRSSAYHEPAVRLTKIPECKVCAVRIEPRPA